MKNRIWVLAIIAAGCLALAACVPAQRAGGDVSSTKASTGGGTATTDAHAFASGTTNNLTKQGKRATPNQR